MSLIYYAKYNLYFNIINIVANKHLQQRLRVRRSSNYSGRRRWSKLANLWVRLEVSLIIADLREDRLIIAVMSSRKDGGNGVLRMVAKSSRDSGEGLRWEIERPPTLTRASELRNLMGKTDAKYRTPVFLRAYRLRADLVNLVFKFQVRFTAQVWVKCESIKRVRKSHF